MPDWGDEIGRRLAHLGLAPAREAEIVEELSQHLDDRFQELRAQGVPVPEAGDVALSELLDTEALARGLRDIERARGPEPIPEGASASGRFAGNLRQDVRYALRVLRKSPAFTAIAVLTLALGIGATTAIFSVVNGVLLRPLPYPEPQRLAAFWLTAPEKGLTEVALPDALVHHYHAQSKTFEHLAAYTWQGFTLTGDGDPERLRGANVTIDFFRVLGKQPVLGRTFRAEETTRGNNLVVILSHAAWQSRFGGDPGIIGRAIILDDIPTVVVGIMPPGFEFPSRRELWIPLVLNPESLDSWYLSAIGRLAAGRSADDARREIATLTDEFMLRRPERFPDAKQGSTRVVAMSLSTLVAGDVRKPLLVLLGSVCLVMLIVSANIANLLLARAAARGHEMALRCCIGASPRRIVAQLLTESLVLAGAGAAGGLVLAYWIVGLMRRLPAAQLPRIDEVHLDPAVLAFAIIVALASGLLFGLVPALRGARVNLQSALKDGARGSVTGANRRLRHAFVVSQLALSLVLLIGAGLLLRSFQRLLAIDPGFRAENTLVARVELPYPKYDSGAVVRRFYARLIESVRTLPAVSSVGLNENVPFSPGNQQNEVIAEGREPRPGEPIPVASVRAVTPGYFAAIGTPILAGRGILDSDTETMPLVAVIDESLSRRFWPNGDAIGKRIRKGVDPASNPWLTVVGTARSVKHTSLDEVGDLQLYEPFAQSPRWGSFLVVRAAGAPEGLTATLRARLAKLDPTLPLFDVHTMEQALDRSLGTKRLTNTLLTSFALIALLLAAIGIYGVMSLHVSARMKEFGIRLALGARPTAVLGLVMREGLTLAVAGVLLGLAGAALLTRLLGGLLYGVRALDAPTFGGVAVILAAVALVACWVPARRATKADPMMALRAE